jgi:hypothetical protein
MTESGDDQFLTIDDVVEVLQSPARADELQGEEEMVAAMGAVILADGPKELALVTTARSRPLTLAVIAGAAVLSLAGVAAATGVLPDRAPGKPPVTSVVTSTNASASAARTSATTSTTAPSTTRAADTTTTGLDTTTTAAAATAAAAPTISAPPCPADVTNHGDYVSRVAHDTPPGPDHGKIVSAAAQSDCGKAAAAPASGPPEQQKPPKANGHSAGNGNGNGKGNSHP